MRDEPEDLIGLTVSLFVPSGDISDGVWILGADGAVGTLFDATILAAEAGVYLEARDRLLLPDQSAWIGRGTVPPGRTMIITTARIVVNSLDEGAATLTCSYGSATATFRQVSYDAPVVTLRPATPFRIEAPRLQDATFTMTLGVERTGANDGVLEARFTTERQPADQRLRIETTSGAGLPSMRIKGRIG